MILVAGPDILAITSPLLKEVVKCFEDCEPILKSLDVPVKKRQRLGFQAQLGLWFKGK